MSLSDSILFYSILVVSALHSLLRSAVTLIIAVVGCAHASVVIGLQLNACTNPVHLAISVAALAVLYGPVSCMLASPLIERKMYSQTGHAKCEQVYVDTKLTESQLKSLRATFTGVEFVPAPHATERDHGALRCERAYAYRKIDSMLVGAGITGVVVDIGGNPSMHRYHMLRSAGNGITFHSAAPTLDSTDRIRRLRADIAMNACDHSFPDAVGGATACNCDQKEQFAAFMSVDTIYYLTPEQVLRSLMRTRTGLGFAALHRFDSGDTCTPGVVTEQLGTFYGESHWRVYPRKVGDRILPYVSMTARGGSAPYSHPLPVWLNLHAEDDTYTGSTVHPRHFTAMIDGERKAMSWEISSGCGSMSIVTFRIDKPREEESRPVPDSLETACNDPHHSSDVNYHSPGHVAGTGFANYVAASVGTGAIWSFGPLLIVANSQRQCLLIPKAAVAEARFLLAAHRRGKKGSYTTFTSAVRTLLEARYNLPKDMIADFIDHILPSLYGDVAASTRSLEHGLLPSLAKWPFGKSAIDRHDELLDLDPKFDFATLGWRAFGLVCLFLLVTNAWIFRFVYDSAFAWSVTVVNETEYQSLGRRCVRQTLQYSHKVFAGYESRTDNCQSFFNLLFSTAQHVPGVVMKSTSQVIAHALTHGASRLVEGLREAVLLAPMAFTTTREYSEMIGSAAYGLIRPQPQPDIWGYVLGPFVILTVFVVLFKAGYIRVARGDILTATPFAFGLVCDFFARCFASCPIQPCSLELTSGTLTAMFALAVSASVFNPAFVACILLILVWWSGGVTVDDTHIGHPEHRALPDGYTRTGPYATRSVTTSNLVDPPMRDGVTLTRSSASYLRNADRPINLQLGSVNGITPVTASSNEENINHALRGRCLQQLSTDDDGLSYDPVVMADFFEFSYNYNHYLYPGTTGHFGIPLENPYFAPTNIDPWKARFTKASNEAMETELEARLAGRLSDARFYRRGIFNKVEYSEFLMSFVDDPFGCFCPRAIITVSDALKRMIGPAVHGLMGLMKRIWSPTHFIVFGSGLNPIETGAIFHKFRSFRAGAVSVVEADMKRFDSTLNLPLLEHACEIADRLGATRKRALCPDGKPFTHHMRRLATMTIKSNHGTKATGAVGRGSGDMDTSRGNGAISGETQAYAVSLATATNPSMWCSPDLYEEGKLRIQILVNGDDSAVLYDADWENPTTGVRIRFDFEVYENALRSLGLNPVVQPGRNIDTVTFCSARPYLCQVNTAAPFSGKLVRSERERLGAENHQDMKHGDAVELLHRADDAADAMGYFGAADGAAADLGVAEWTPSSVMGPKIGRVIPKYLAINDPKNPNVLTDPESNWAMLYSHFRAVAVGYDHVAAHVPIVNDMTDFVLARTDPDFCDYKSVEMPTLIRNAGARDQFHRERVRMRPVRQTDDTLNQCCRIYGWSRDIQNLWRDALKAIPDIKGFNLNFEQLQSCIELDNAQLFDVKSDAFWRIVSVLLEELLKDVVGWWIIGIPEFFMRHPLNMALHFSWSYLDIELRIVVHLLWNFLIVPYFKHEDDGPIQEAGLLSSPGANTINSLNKNRVMKPHSRLARAGHSKIAKSLLEASAKSRGPKGNFHPSDVRHKDNVKHEPAVKAGSIVKPAPKAPTPAVSKGKLLEPALKEARNRNHGGDSASARAAGMVGLVQSIHNAIKGNHETSSAMRSAKVDLHTADLKHFDVVDVPAHTAARVTDSLGLKSTSTTGTTAAPIAVATKLKTLGPHFEAAKAVRFQRLVPHGKGFQARNVIRIANREPLGVLAGTSQYSVQQFAANPGNSALFPWLSILAQPMEMYFFFNLTMWVFTELATNKKGRVILNDDPDVNDFIPTGRTALEVQRGTDVSTGWQNTKHSVLISHTQHVNWYYINNAATSNAGDPRLNNQTRLQIATIDCEDTTANGEMWMSYVVELMEPTANLSSVSSLSGAPAIYSVGGASAGVMYGLTNAGTGTSCLVVGSATSYQPISPGNFVYSVLANFLQMNLYFPCQVTGTNYTTVGGSYLFICLDIGTGLSCTTPNPSAAFPNISTHTTNWNGAVSTVQNPASATQNNIIIRIDVPAALTYTTQPYIQFTGSATTHGLKVVQVVTLAQSVTVLGDHRIGKLSADGSVFRQADVSKIKGLEGEISSVVNSLCVVPAPEPAGIPELFPIDTKTAYSGRDHDEKTFVLVPASSIAAGTR